MEASLQNFSEVVNENFGAMKRAFAYTDMHLSVLRKKLTEMAAERGEELDLAPLYEEYVKVQNDPYAVAAWVGGSSVEEALTAAEERNKSSSATVADDPPPQDGGRVFGGDYEGQTNESAGVG